MDILCDWIIPAVFVAGSIWLGVNVMACVMLGRLRLWEDEVNDR
jgi:hypothetical protein